MSTLFSSSFFLFVCLFFWVLVDCSNLHHFAHPISPFHTAQNRQLFLGTLAIKTRNSWTNKIWKKQNKNKHKWNAMNLSFQLSLLPINVIVYARCTVCNFMQTENFTLNHLVYPNVLADIIMICVCVCAHLKCASLYSNEELQHT